MKSISRRNAVKNLAALSSILVMPVSIPWTTEKPLHFIGLGGAGTTAIKHIYSKGIKAKYTAITCTYGIYNLPSYFSGISFDPYQLISDNSASFLTKVNELQTSIEQNSLITSIFETNEHFVIFAGLGLYSGSALSLSLSKLLSKKKKTFLTINFIPLSLEGVNRRNAGLEIALRLSKLKNCKHFDLDDLLNKNKTLSYIDFIEKVNETFSIYYEKEKANFNL